jgi:hypothetical protein
MFKSNLFCWFEELALAYFIYRIKIVNMSESLPEASFSKFSTNLVYKIAFLTIFILLQTCYGAFTHFFNLKT